MADVHTYVVCS